MMAKVNMARESQSAGGDELPMLMLSVLDGAFKSEPCHCER